MIKATWQQRRFAGARRRVLLRRLSDGLPVLVAGALPWSTSISGILIALWIVVTLPVLNVRLLSHHIRSIFGGTAVALAGVGIVGFFWADAPLSERAHGLLPFLRLLLVPVLLTQFSGSANGVWVAVGFLVSASVLLALSFAMILWPSFLVGPYNGVPFKDYISQSGIFLLSAFALFQVALDSYRSRRHRYAVVSLGLGLLFIANIAYVTTSRTTLVVGPILLLLLWWRQRQRQLAWVLVGGALLAALITWSSSSYLRDRVIGAAAEITSYEASGPATTSTAFRFNFWRTSVHIIEGAPFVGHGTGSIKEMFRREAPTSGDLNLPTNPHNEILTIGIQLGLLGVLLLLAMWTAHCLLFSRAGLMAWIGLAAVTQNIVGSLFNSHLMDFTQSWLYVFTVGVFGGTVLRSSDTMSLERSSHREAETLG
jgi:O-antigen ligase